MFKELEIEKQNKKKLEKDLKKASETLEEERTRQKTIIFMLLSERKKYFLKYNEDQKRSEDLAQVNFFNSNLKNFILFI